MNGQWIGDYTGTKPGRIIVNIDERSSNFEGVAYLFEEGQAVAETAAFFRTLNKDTNFEIRTGLILPIDRRTFIPAQWSMVSDQYPGYVLPEYADVTGSLVGGRLSLRWRTNINTIGEAILERSTADRPSDLSSRRENWAKFKEYVAELKGRRYLFRGQNQPWRLRTSFHRAGRADVGRFHNQDVQALHKHLSARTKHVFNLSNADENGAFFNLVQHHGYPTPLLDWTYSPYVAAFFAYRDISSKDAKDAAPEKSVRVLVFDQAEWREYFPQILMAAPATRHVSIAEFSAIENERMIPQQAASMVTTVDDIESYIREKETDGRQYLSAFDLPVQERNQVMQDLSFMGITAGSLFPGLDGACEELKGRNFEG